MKTRTFLLVALSVSLSVVFFTAVSETAHGQQAAPAPSPVPSPTVSPSPIPVPIKTYAELQNDIRASVSKYELRRGMVGLKVVSLSSGKVVFEENPEKLFVPASNNKSFAVAVALEKLGPDFRFVTSVLSASAPNKDGVVKGAVSIYGRGDVSVSAMFNEGDPFRAVDALADRIVAAGIKKIEGDLIGDDSFFSGDAVPAGWEYDDLSAYYGAEVSALPLNDNAIDVSVSPGTVGKPCAVRLKPATSAIEVINRCVSVAAGEARSLNMKRSVENGAITVEGKLPVGEKETVRSVAVTRPALLLVSILKERLALKGINVTGKARVISVGEASLSGGSAVEIAKMESAPLSVVAARTMKPSQNMFTEVLLRTLGEQVGDKTDPRKTSSDRGMDVIRAFLRQIGIPDDAYIGSDGSGLSRHNLVSPSTLITLYSHMAKQSSNSQAWMDSLPIGGVDGTIRNRFKGTAATNNVKAKTGTLNQVSGLSGYVTTASGEKLVFSMLVNGIPDASLRISTIDEVVNTLAAFNGRID